MADGVDRKDRSSYGDTVDSISLRIAAAEQRGYERCAKDVEENTVKMIAEGVQRGYVKALEDVQAFFGDPDILQSEIRNALDRLRAEKEGK